MTSALQIAAKLLHYKQPIRLSNAILFPCHKIVFAVMLHSA